MSFCTRSGPDAVEPYPSDGPYVGLSIIARSDLGNNLLTFFVSKLMMTASGALTHCEFDPEPYESGLNAATLFSSVVLISVTVAPRLLQLAWKVAASWVSVSES
jgi:hypothetical protein